MPLIEVTMSPCEFERFTERDLSNTCCVVLDILRATTSIVTALAAGAVEIVPVATISEALEAHVQRPNSLLAGEREGLRITRDLTGSQDFDLGNSPREFVKSKVAGRTIIITTTNGTRALRSAQRAALTLPGAFINLSALVQILEHDARNMNLLIIGSGTHDEVAFEDVLGAGALVDRLENSSAFENHQRSDSSHLAWQVYQAAKLDLLASVKNARNGRRLLEHPELRHDVPVCLTIDSTSVVGRLGKDGVIRRD